MKHTLSFKQFVNEETSINEITFTENKKVQNLLQKLKSSIKNTRIYDEITDAIKMDIIDVYATYDSIVKAIQIRFPNLFGKGKEYERILVEGNEIMESEQILEADNVQNYMFFGNLETIKRHAEMLLALNQQQVDEILKNGHDWAEDHITTCKDDIEEVCNFFQNETKKAGIGSVPERVNKLNGVDEDTNIPGYIELGAYGTAIKNAGIQTTQIDKILKNRNYFDVYTTLQMIDGDKLSILIKGGLKYVKQGDRSIILTF
jgi:hypothetical protein